MLSRTTVAIIAVLIAVMSFASNEAFARSAGGGGAHGVVGLGAPRSINRGGGPGLGWGRFPAIRARNFALGRGLRFRRTWFGGAWPDDCFSYGGCYQVPGGVEPYDNDVNSLGPPPTVIVLRPPCRLQPEKYVVPSEDGGERSVKVIRCLPAAGFPSPGLGNTSVRAVTDAEGAVR
jgi:hypothetical protein